MIPVGPEWTLKFDLVVGKFRISYPFPLHLPNIKTHSKDPLNCRKHSRFLVWIHLLMSVLHFSHVALRRCFSEQIVLLNSCNTPFSHEIGTLTCRDYRSMENQHNFTALLIYLPLNSFSNYYICLWHLHVACDCILCNQNNYCLSLPIFRRRGFH